MKSILPYIFCLLFIIPTINAQEIEFAGFSWSNTNNFFALSDDGSLCISTDVDTTKGQAFAKVADLNNVTHYVVEATINCNVSNNTYIRLYLMESDTINTDGFYLRMGTNNHSVSLVRSSGDKLIINGSKDFLQKDKYPYHVRAEIDVVHDANGISHFALQSTINTADGEQTEKNDTTYSLKISNPQYMIARVGFSANNRDMAINNIQIERQEPQKPEEPQEPEPSQEPEEQPIANDVFYRGCVVINELMTNPNDELGLPDRQYIELYNTTNNAIDISNWQISVNATLTTIANYILPPDGYVCLCSKSAEADMAKVTAAIATTQKALTLTKNSGRVVLRNAQGKVADYVDYSIDMFGGTFKNDGGWSIERIDPFNISANNNNFVPSVSPQGGTPSARNSVDGSLPDDIAPHILSLIPNATADTLHLALSEPIDTATFRNTFTIDNNEQPLRIASTDDVTLTRFSIALNQPLRRHQIYHVSNIWATDYAGNQITDCIVQTAIAEKAQPKQIVINEIMSTASPTINDYIEIYNPTTDVFNLYDICFGQIKNAQLSSCNRICNYNRLFFPGEYIVVCADSTSLTEAYNVPNKQYIVSNAKFSNLPSEGEVAISNILGEIIDNVPYTEKMHSQLITDTHNVALERIMTNAASDTPQNWTSASALSGYATPTAINSQNRDNKFQPTTNIEQVVRRFSPNADGIDDNMVLSTNFADGEWIATMRIYAPNGVLIATPYNNTPLPVSGELIWNGQNTQGTIMPHGTYIIMVSVWQTGGKKYEWKGTCTIGENER